MTIRLEGNVAVITGGNSGIGLATAQRFVAESAHVFITGHRQAELDLAVTQIGKHVTGVRGDVSTFTNLDRLFATVKQHKGRLDVLFANAGVEGLAPLGSISEEHYPASLSPSSRALERPTQRRLRVTASRRIDQCVKCCPQPRVDFSQLLATTTRVAKPGGDRLVGMSPATFQVAYSRRDRVSCQARGDGDGRDATPTQCHRFGGGPLPPHSLVHHRSQSEEFLSNSFRRGRVSHAPRMRN
jgi:short chain dehydrogenase